MGAVSFVDYILCDPQPSTTNPSGEAAPLGLSLLSEAGAIRHVFATSGPKMKPIRVDVHGRKDRRAICVLYGDAMRYEVLDMDIAYEHDEDDTEV